MIFQNLLNRWPVKVYRSPSMYRYLLIFLPYFLFGQSAPESGTETRKQMLLANTVAVTKLQKSFYQEENITKLRLQRVLWKKLLYLEPSNTNYFLQAYLGNYFYAYQMNKGSIPLADQALLDSIYKTYEGDQKNASWHYISYLQKKEKDPHTASKHIKEAYALDPQNKLILESYILELEKTQDTRHRDKIVQEYLALYPDASLLLYFNDLLEQMASPLIYITRNETEAIYLWYLKTVKFTEKDIRVLFLPLVKKGTYLEKLLRDETPEPQEIKQLAEKDIPGLLCRKKTAYQYAFSPNLGKEILQQYQGELMLSGNYYRWSEDPSSTYTENFINTSAVLRIMNEGQLKKPESELAHLLYRNYFNGLLYLYKHYRKNAEEEKASDMKSMAMKLADILGIKTEIASYFQ